MICDKAVMSRLQVAPGPPPPVPPSPNSSPPLEWGERKKNGSAVSSSQRTFISPHLCGLWSDDLGLQPSQPSWHLRKKKKKEGVGWEKVGNGRERGGGIQTGEGWRLQKEDGKETGGSEYGFSIPAASFFLFFVFFVQSNRAAEACLAETLCTAACEAHTADSEINKPL